MPISIDLRIAFVLRSRDKSLLVAFAPVAFAPLAFAPLSVHMIGPVMMQFHHLNLGNSFDIKYKTVHFPRLFLSIFNSFQ